MDARSELAAYLSASRLAASPRRLAASPPRRLAASPPRRLAASPPRRLAASPSSSASECSSEDTDAILQQPAFAHAALLARAVAPRPLFVSRRRQWELSKDGSGSAAERPPTDAPVWAEQQDQQYQQQQYHQHHHYHRRSANAAAAAQRDHAPSDYHLLQRTAPSPSAWTGAGRAGLSPVTDSAPRPRQYATAGGFSARREAAHAAAAEGRGPEPGQQLHGVDAESDHTLRALQHCRGLLASMRSSAGAPPTPAPTQTAAGLLFTKATPSKEAQPTQTRTSRATNKHPKPTAPTPQSADAALQASPPRQIRPTAALRAAATSTPRRAALSSSRGLYPVAWQ